MFHHKLFAKTVILAPAGLLTILLTAPAEVSAVCDVETTYAWTAAQPLGVESGFSPNVSYRPKLDTDEAGVWVTVWSTDVASPDSNKGYLARSDDNADSWAPPIDLLPPNAESVYMPVVATNTQGTWITAFRAQFPAPFLNYLSRSTDNGQTWSTPLPLTATDSSNVPGTLIPHEIESDDNSTWIILWNDLTISRSTDNGLSWSPRIDFGISADEETADIATDANGVWVIAFHTFLSGSNGFIRSTDNGATWSPPQFVNNLSDLFVVSIDTDRFGNWFVVLSPDSVIWFKYAVSHSIDNGASWSDFAEVFDTEVSRMDIAVDRDEGRWMAMSRSQNALHYRTLFEAGPPWPGGQTTGATIPEFPKIPSIKTDQNRTWVAVYGTTTTFAVKTAVPAEDADLSISKTAAPNPATAGQALDYLLEISNLGDLDAPGVTLVDTLPPDATFISATPAQGTCGHSAGTVLCELGTLACQTSTSVTIRVRPEVGGDYVNNASVASNRIDLNPDNNVVNITTSVGPRADLALTKTAPASAVPGSTFAYTLSVDNNGPFPASGMVVTDVLPTQVAFVDAVPSQGTCAFAGGTVTCDLGTLPAAGTATVTINVSATTVGAATNTASVTAAEFDPNSANNSSSATTNISATADLSIDKSAPASAVDTNTFAYTITVQNGGPNTATAVTVTDTLPTQVVYLSSTASQGSCSFAAGTLTCNLGTVAASGSATITLNVTAIAVGTAVNVASVAAAEPDLVPGNNSDSVATEIVVNGPPDLRGTWQFVVTKCRSFAGPVRCRLRGRLEVQNLGIPRRSSRNTVQFYLSSDNVLGDDLPLSSRTIRGIKPDRSRRITFTRSLPTGLSPGGMYVIAVLDATNAVAENNEQNNIIVIGPIVL